MRQNVLCILLFLVSVGLFAQPTSNPVVQYYPSKDNNHWTEKLAWDNVTDVTTTNAVTKNNNFTGNKWPNAGATGKDIYEVDSAHLATVLSNISSSNNGNGGVLYFPEAEYIFDFDVYLPDNVVLRGAKPVSGQQNAKMNNFSPPSVFLFPKYIPSFSGEGTANWSAFKHIHGMSSCDSAGLAWITMNRAVLNFLAPPDEWSKTITESDEAPYVGTYGQPQPSTIMTDILVFGVRSANAVEADKDVPSGSQHAWQRYTNRRIGNFNAFIYKNGFIANNRLNDVEDCADFADGYPKNGDPHHSEPYGSEAASSYTNTTYPIQSDNFSMQNYLLEDGSSVDDTVRFNYNFHYGMNINRGKLAYHQEYNMTNWYGTQWHYTPETEPASMGTNIEIIDNWIFKKMRPALQVGGNGIVVERNILRDDPDKQNDDIEVNATGRYAPQGQNTFENRGIDISGWNCVVDSNWLEAYRVYVAGYLSTDGEGILHQESSGSSINGMTITNNVMYEYLGLYKSKDMYDVNVSGNEIYGSYIMVRADHNNGVASIYNTSVNNNLANSIEVRGSAGGKNVEAQNNEAAGGYQLSCYVDTAGNTGGAIEWYEADSAAGVTVGGPCTLSKNYPSVALTSHTPDSIYKTSQLETVDIAYQCARDDNPSDFSDWTYTLYVNTDTVTGQVNPDGSVNYTWEIPAYNSYNIKAKVNDGSYKTYSSVMRYEVYPFTTLESIAPATSDITIYPNPAGERVKVELPETFEGGMISIVNMSGMIEKSISNVQSVNSLKISGLNAGIYFVTASNGKTKIVKTLVVE